ncbi:MAG: tetratricopeptide repeat protein, partial [Myxococcota bacterium]
LQRAGRLRDARLVCRTALESDPSDADLLVAAAEVAMALGEAIDARTMLVRAAQLAPDWPEPMIRLASLLFEAQETGRAWAAIERARAMAPNDGRVLMLHAELEQAHRLTLRMLRYLTGDGRDDGAMLANALVAEGRAEDALDVLAHCLSHDPEDADALFVQGNLLRAQGQLDRARAALRRVTQVASGWAEGWDAMADLLEDLGEGEHAERLRAHAATIEVDPLMLIDMAVVAGQSSPLELTPHYPEMEFGEDLDEAIAVGVQAMRSARRADPTGPFALPQVRSKKGAPEDVAPDAEREAAASSPPAEFASAEEDAAFASVEIVFPMEIWGPAGHPGRVEDAAGECAAAPEAPPKTAEDVVSNEPTLAGGSLAPAAPSAARSADLSAFGEGELFPSIDIDLSELVPAARALVERAQPERTLADPSACTLLRTQLCAYLNRTSAGGDGSHGVATLPQPFAQAPKSRLALIDGEVQLVAGPRVSEAAADTLLGNGFAAPLAPVEDDDTLFDHVPDVGARSDAPANAADATSSDAQQADATLSDAADHADEADATLSEASSERAATTEPGDATEPLLLMRRAHARRASLRDAILASAGVAAEELAGAVADARRAAQESRCTETLQQAEVELDEFIEEVVVRPRLRIGKKRKAPYIPPPPSRFFAPKDEASVEGADEQV